VITDAQARLVGSLPADRWEQASHRLEAFANAMADADPAIADLRSVGRAPSLGRLVRARRSTMNVRHDESGQPCPTTRQAIRRREVAKLVAEVRSRAGRELPDHVLIAEVRRRCGLEGLPVPSATTLRDAVADGGPVDLRIRLGRRFDLIIDACPLDIDVQTSTGRSEMAILVDRRTGRSSPMTSQPVGWTPDPCMPCFDRRRYIASRPAPWWGRIT